MPIKQITTALGNSLPPEAPHNITFHIPGWDTAKALRRGDPELLSKLSSIYPRFGPWREVRELSQALHPLLSLPPTHALILFTHPSALRTTQSYSLSPWRKPEHRIPPADLLFRVVDIPLTLPLPSEPEGDRFAHGETVRLYVVAYPVDRAPGAVGVWQNYGVGISSRLAAALLPAVGDGRVEVNAWRGDGNGEVGEGSVPGTGYLPVGEAHRGLRRRIAGLVGGGEGGEVDEGDVWLYPTGMAAIYRLHRALVEVRGGGTVVVLGSVFHNTYHLLEEGEGGMKHFGRCDGGSGVMEALEEWLEGEKKAGRRVAYVFVEFPSNPILVSVDLRRLREVADKYGVPVVIDDTIGSFCNIDVSGVADVIMTSITKSLSGYANVMGGSIVVVPSSPHHAPLKSTLTTHFRNEFFHADAAKLLSNSSSYHARSAILNRNALTLATYLHSASQSPASPLTAVLYPPFTDTAQNYAALMRAPYKPATPTPTLHTAPPPTATPTAPTQTPTTTQTTTATHPDPKSKENPTELFHPGHGCLLALEFTTLRVARAFYDTLSVYHGPHLGAHHTLAFPFNDAIWGTDPEGAAYLRTYGAKAEQVRISVGLEEEQELVDTFAAALEVAEGVRKLEEEEGR